MAVSTLIDIHFSTVFLIWSLKVFISKVSYWKQQEDDWDDRAWGPGGVDQERTGHWDGRLQGGVRPFWLESQWQDSYQCKVNKQVFIVTLFKCNNIMAIFFLPSDHGIWWKSSQRSVLICSAGTSVCHAEGWTESDWCRGGGNWIFLQNLSKMRLFQHFKFWTFL